MPVNYDGRMELRLFYTTTINSRPLAHRYTVDVNIPSPDAVDPGTPFADISCENRNGSTQTLADATASIEAVVKPIYRPTTEFSRWELWRYPAEPSTNPAFVSALVLGVPGTAAAGVDLDAQQLTITYRTIGGNQARVQFMEHFITGNGYQTAPLTPAALQSLAALYIGLNQPFLGRDNTPMLAIIGCGLGQNEKLFRKRFRSV